MLGASRFVSQSVSPIRIGSCSVHEKNCWCDTPLQILVAHRNPQGGSMRTCVVMLDLSQSTLSGRQAFTERRRVCIAPAAHTHHCTLEMTHSTNKSTCTRHTRTRATQYHPDTTQYPKARETRRQGQGSGFRVQGSGGPDLCLQRAVVHGERALSLVGVRARDVSRGTRRGGRGPPAEMKFQGKHRV